MSVKLPEKKVGTYDRLKPSGLITLLMISRSEVGPIAAVAAMNKDSVTNVVIASMSGVGGLAPNSSQCSLFLYR